jgi:hypothetical protein
MKLKILGKTYAVHFVPHDDLPKDYGECNNEEQWIKVRTDTHPETQADTFLHEVIHAVDFAVNAGMTERQVHSIATGLLAVFLDNPEFSEWITLKNMKNI